jgi:hypothetical protein
MNVWMIVLAGLSLSAQNTDNPQPIGGLADTTRAPEPAPVVTATCDGNVEYCASPDQIRVDHSFSKFPIDSGHPSKGSVLTEVRIGGCEVSGECAWIDDNKVRHYFWADSPEGLYLVVKMIEASDFAGRPIPALGIGTARKKIDVVANIRSFLPEIEIDCDHVSGNVGPVECGGTLNPGWFQIGFDLEGNLQTIRFDGYQFI